MVFSYHGDPGSGPLKVATAAGGENDEGAMETTVTPLQTELSICLHGSTNWIERA